jgi:hypothetical protein
MMASLADLDLGEFKEGHQLDAKMIKRIPKGMIGKRLSRTQAARLLNSLEQQRA